jgi:hypothetical protein
VAIEVMLKWLYTRRLSLADLGMVPESDKLGMKGDRLFLKTDLYTPKGYGRSSETIGNMWQEDSIDDIAIWVLELLKVADKYNLLSLAERMARKLRSILMMAPHSFSMQDCLRIVRPLCREQNNLTIRHVVEYLRQEGVDDMQSASPDIDDRHTCFDSLEKVVNLLAKEEARKLRAWMVTERMNAVTGDEPWSSNCCPEEFLMVEEI